MVIGTEGAVSFAGAILKVYCAGIVIALCSENLPEILEIERLSNPLPWTETSLRAEFSNPCAVLLGIRKSGVLRGFILAHAVAGEAHIVSFAIHPDWRRLGLGKQLLGELLRRLHEDGCLTVTLEVRQGNAPAVTLYANEGFFEAGVRVAYYRDSGEDARLMRLDLKDWVLSK